MKIKRYNEFCNEEIDVKKAFIGGALIGGLAVGLNQCDTDTKKTTASYQETEIADFPEYYVKTGVFFDDNLNLSINNNNGVIGVKRDAGKYSDYSVTVEEGTSKIWYKTSTWGEYIYASTDPNDLPGSSMIDLNELSVVSETPEYRILDVPNFWSSFDYIFVNKGYKNVENEFEINGAKYTYFEPSFGFLRGKAAFVVKCR